MTYHLRGLGLAVATKPLVMTLPTKAQIDAGKAAVAAAKPMPFVLPTRAQIDAGKVASAPVASIVTPDCAGFQYVVGYKPLPRTGVVRAGTPIVAACKVTWNPATAGADFPGSWVALRNRDADSHRQALDAATSAASPGLPATSTALLTTATKAFLIGFSMLGTNAAILYVGAVSTRDVNMEQMQYFLKRLFHVPMIPPTGIIAYAVVPLKRANEVVVPTDPVANSVTYPERIGSKYDINTARYVAISAGIALREALQVMVSGEIFGSLAVASSQPLFFPGEREVLAAIEVLRGAASFADLPAGVTTAMASLVAEAEAAKTLSPEDGDKACADILARISAMQSAVDADLNGKLATLTAGAASLASAQAAAGAYTNNARALEADTRNKVQAKIADTESRPGFTSLTPGEQRAVHCIMLNKAAPIIASRVAVAQPRVDMLASIPPAEFAAAVASASASASQALTAVDVLFADATTKVEAIRAQIALDWYARDFHGLPVWMWGAGGAAVLLGGALVVRKLKSKKAAA